MSQLSLMGDALAVSGTKQQRWLGIDPGTSSIGIGVIDYKGGGQFDHVAHGMLKIGKHKDLGSRMIEIKSELMTWLNKYQPDSVACEAPASRRGVKSHHTALAIIQCRGVMVMAVEEWRAGTKIVDSSPPAVKKSATFDYKASKKEMQLAIQRILGLEKPPRPNHAADALCVAYFAATARLLV